MYLRKTLFLSLSIINKQPFLLFNNLIHGFPSVSNFFKYSVTSIKLSVNSTLSAYNRTQNMNRQKKNSKYYNIVWNYNPQKINFELKVVSTII